RTSEADVYPPPSPPFRRFHNRWRVHIGLFLLTVASTTLLGSLNYAAFHGDSGLQKIFPAVPTGYFALVWAIIKTFYLQGLAYSAAVLAILGAHELGHYVA